jgi:signal transduction histidine kinase/CheY-like chemotaxis protein
MNQAPKASHRIETPLNHLRFDSLKAKSSLHADRSDSDATVVQRLLSLWGRLGYRPDLDVEETRRRKLFSVLILPGILLLFTLGLYHFSIGELDESLFELLVGCWLTLTLATLRVFKNGALLYRLNSALFGSLFLFLMIKGGAYGHKILWSFIYPLLAFYPLGKREGLIFTAVLYVLAICILYLPQDFIQVYAYGSEFKLRFCMVFFLVASLTAIYEWVREYFHSRLEDERNKLEAEKTKLNELSEVLQKVNLALKVSEERLRHAQAIARVGNIEYDIGSGMLWASEEALRIIGLQTDDPQFPLSDLERMIPDFAVFWQDLEKCIQNNNGYDREWTMQHLTDHTPLVLRVKPELIRDPSGAPQKLIGVIQDVSDRKAAERKRRELEEKLARSQKMESLGLLAGGVAHDLNNVLSGMVGYPDMLLRELPPASPLAKPLQRIQQSGQKAAAIVQDLLTLARRGVSNHKVLNLNQLMTEFMESPEQADIQARHPRISFETTCDPVLQNIKGSAVHLKKTIMNLISNAAEALTNNSGRVQIRTENYHVGENVKGNNEIPHGDYVVLHVQDNGIGICEEDLSKIFEPFYTKKKMGRSGTGLGMSVVWGTVQDHNGYIHIDSTEGVGTNVTTYLPASRKPVAIQKCEVPPDAYLGQGETILVVDDVLEQRELAQSLLAGLGYAVHTAVGGEAALDFLSNRPVDLVILDMIMDPGIDGLETYARILESYPDQRAIIVSGFSETDRVRGAQRLGAEVYVKKPYTIEKLGLAVRQALSRQADP